MDLDVYVEYQFCKIWLEWLLVMLTKYKIVEWKVYECLGDIRAQLWNYIEFGYTVFDCQKMAASFYNHGYVDSEDEIEPNLRHLVFKIKKLRSYREKNQLMAASGDPPNNWDKAAIENQNEMNPPLLSDYTRSELNDTLDQGYAWNPEVIPSPLNRKRRATDIEVAPDDAKRQVPTDDVASKPGCNRIWIPTSSWPQSLEDLLARATEFINHLKDKKFVAVVFDEDPNPDPRDYEQQAGPSQLPNSRRKKSTYAKNKNTVFCFYEELKKEKEIFGKEFKEMTTSVKSLDNDQLKETLQEIMDAVENFVRNPVANNRVVDNNKTKNTILIAMSDLPFEIAVYQCLTAVLKRSHELVESARKAELPQQNADYSLNVSGPTIGEQHVPTVVPVDEFERNTNSIFPSEDTNDISTYQLVNRSQPLPNHNVEFLEDDEGPDYSFLIPHRLDNRKERVNSDEWNKDPMFCQFSPPRQTSFDRLSYENSPYFDLYDSN